jgi:hypothetical protein
VEKPWIAPKSRRDRPASGRRGPQVAHTLGPLANKSTGYASSCFLITNETPQAHGLSHRRGHTGAVSTTAGVRIMAKSRIRFRKGLGLHNCLAPYGTEEQCADALFGRSRPQGVVCPGVGACRGRRRPARARADAAQALPTPDLAHRRDALRLNHAAPDRPVSRHGAAHAAEKHHRRT